MKYWLSVATVLVSVTLSFLVSRYTADERVFEMTRDVSPIQGMQLADYYGIPPVDGTTICATPTVGACATMALGSGSTATPIAFGATTTTLTTVGAAATDSLIINATGISTTGNLLNLQTATVTKWNVDSTGQVTEAQKLNVTAGGIQASGANITDSAAGGIIQATGNSGAGGLLKATPAINSTFVTTEVLPILAMSAGGATSAIGSTIRAVQGTCVFSASTSCVTSTQAGGAVWANAFTTNPACFAGGNSTSGLVTMISSTTNGTLTAANSNSQTINYVCIGV